MTDDHDDEVFRAAMSGVRRLEAGRLPAAHERLPAELAARRQAAAMALDGDVNALTCGEVPQIGPFDELAFRRDGIQHGVFRKLRLGQYPIQASLDLHRRNVREACDDVFAFYRESVRLGLRCVLVTHGKGVKSETPGRLKSFVAHWLGQLPQVLAYHSAQQRHGGSGAVYVLLRKSDSDRRENREIHHQKGDPAHT